MSRRRIAAGIVAVAAIAGVAIAIGRGLSAAAPRVVPTTHVQRGRVDVTVFTNGELRATRTMQLIVPPTGGQLQIIKLADPGEAVKNGDVVVEFDPAEQQFNLEQAQFDLRLAEQEIAKADAQAAVQAAGDEVALLHARYDVRRAELETQANELVSEITARQNVLLLEEASQRRTQLDTDVIAHRTTTLASAAGLREKRNKAQLAVQVAERNIASLTVRAPFDGYVTIRTNFMAFGGIGFPGMPEYRVGDSTFTGQTVADVFDTSHVEVTAKLSERDRANVAPGQAVEVSVDAAPAAKLRGTVRAVSGVASRSMFETGTRQFDIAFDVDGRVVVRPGVTAAISIAGPTFDDVLYVPRTAVFDAAGKPAVYVRAGTGFEAHEVRVRAWTDSFAVIENIDQAAEIALINPNAASGTRARPQTAAAPQRAAR
jgi:multidrug efflux pump subunit AcrA (membrane-fusion protein)